MRTYAERLSEYSSYVKARTMRCLPLDRAIVHAALMDAIEEQERVERERIAERALAETRHVAAVAVDPGRFRREPTAEQLAFRAMRLRVAPMEGPDTAASSDPGDVYQSWVTAGARAIVDAAKKARGEEVD